MNSQTESKQNYKLICLLILVIIICVILYFYYNSLGDVSSIQLGGSADTLESLNKLQDTINNFQKIIRN